jgi:hypothetical protein
MPRRRRPTETAIRDERDTKVNTPKNSIRASLTEEPRTEDQTHDVPSLLPAELEALLPTLHPVWKFVVENEIELRIFARNLFKPNDPERNTEADLLVLHCAREIEWENIDLDDPAPIAKKKRRFNKNVPKKNNKMSFFKTRLKWRFKDHKGFTTRHSYGKPVIQDEGVDQDASEDTMHTLVEGNEQDEEAYVIQDEGEDQDAYEDTMKALIEGDEKEQEEARERTTWMYDEDDHGEIVAYDDDNREGVDNAYVGSYTHYVHNEKYQFYYDLARRELMGEILEKFLDRHAAYLRKNRRGELMKRLFIDEQSYPTIKRLLGKNILSKRSIYKVREYLQDEGAKSLHDDLRQEYQDLSEEDIAFRAHEIHRRFEEDAWEEDKKQNPWKYSLISKPEEPPWEEEPSEKQ